jgi:hypothetical protein
VSTPADIRSAAEIHSPLHCEQKNGTNFPHSAPRCGNPLHYEHTLSGLLSYKRLFWTSTWVFFMKKL